MFPQSSLSQEWQLGLASLLAIVGAIAVASDCALAQIKPDATLGTESSVVTPLDPLPYEVIDGGAKRGANLFHSFREFNVDAGRQAYFTNPPEIKNIFSRVTGGSRSEILGTLGVFGPANLFLINPNGIIFGPNASLLVGGSFVATTANAIGFGDRGFFSATAPDVPPVLTVNPSALLFNQIANQPIANQSVAGLQLPANQSLLLVGGDVNLEGGKLLAPSGRVELGGLAGAGTVGLQVDGSNLRLSFPSGVARADVSLSNGASVDVSYFGGGDIQLQGRRVTLADGSQIVANTLGSERGGKLTVTASESVEVIGGSRLLAETTGAGTAGELRIETGKLIVQGGAQVAAGTLPDSTGPGGTLTVRASESVQLSGTSADGQVTTGLFTQTEGAGQAGELRIETGQLIVRDGAQASASTVGAGQGGTLAVTASDSVELSGTSTSADATKPSGLLAVTQGGSGSSGNLTIETGRLIVRDGAQVSASTRGAGQGGTLAVTASDSIELSGTSANGQFRSGLLVGTTGGIGSAGDLRIETGRLIVRDGAWVSALTAGQGRGGTLAVSAPFGLVEVIGSGSSLTTETQGASEAGNLTITTGQLRVQDGARISAQTFGSGQGGTLTVTAPESVTLSGGGSLSAQATADGNAGDLTINTLALTVQDGAQVTVSSPKGQAGNLTVMANSMLLDQGNLTAVTGKGQGEGGANITLQVPDLLLMGNESRISADALGQAFGGNINIDTKFLIAQPPQGSSGSDIAANAVGGNGGRLDITASGIFGISSRPSETALNDITASSEFGAAGVVTLNTPDVDPSQGLVSLPVELVDASNSFATGCAAGGENEFIVTGRGGLPPSPTDTLSSDTVWSDLRSNPKLARTPSSSEEATNPTLPEPAPIVEATGWVINNKGEVVLIATAPTATQDIPWIRPDDCHTP